jgi:D-lactate dehydrogenase
VKIAFFSTKGFERPFFDQLLPTHPHEITYIEAPLREPTANLAAGHDAICAFVNDQLGGPALEALKALGVRLVLLRSAGFNHVDIAAADRLGLTVLRVPKYSPYAVAEHTVGLMLALNRKLHRAYNRVREQNFALDGLMGFDLHGRTAGVVGTGKIGAAVAGILLGFGCRVLAHDPDPDQECRRAGVEYVPLDELYRRSDIVTLHCPLTPQTRHIVDADALAAMKDGVMLINTSRGALMDSRALIQGLKSGRIGYLGLDVYEEEQDLFFQNLSEEVIHDDVFVRLMTFPNVLITAHQGFFTREAVANIAETTLRNATDFERGNIQTENCVNQRLVAG